MILTELITTTEAFAAGTGWDPKPEGLCRGEVCVPAPGRTLPTAVAADPELVTLDGSLFRLSSLHGRKVLLVAWSSY